MYREERNVLDECDMEKFGTLLRGTIIIRTCDQHKNIYNPLFLLAIRGPDYYVSR